MTCSLPRRRMFVCCKRPEAGCARQEHRTIDSISAQNLERFAGYWGRSVQVVVVAAAAHCARAS
jgi:hypothetical protein